MVTDIKDIKSGLWKKKLSFIEQVWGFSLYSITMEGVSMIIIDVVTCIISTFLLFGAPIIFSTYYERWTTCVLVLILAMFVLWPALMRLLYGKYPHTSEVELE